MRDEFGVGEAMLDNSCNMLSYILMKTAKIFANGRSRAVRIPGEWLKGADEVELSYEGDRVVIKPIRPTLGEVAESFAKDPLKISRKPQTQTPPRAILQ